jgi:hypothetical protein
MGALPERVAYLEGQMVEQSQTLVAIRADIRDLGQRLDTRMDRLDQRMERLDERIDRQGQRTEHVYDSLNNKMSRQFRWLVGIQVTTLLVIISALLARG